MLRRHLLQSGLLSGLIGGWLMKNTSGALPNAGDAMDSAVRIIRESVESGQVRSAVIVARTGSRTIEHAFGDAELTSPFLLGSISKPICVAALMTLVDQKKLSLSDPAQKYLPDFKQAGSEQVTVSHLLTHVSGLPDQVPENAELRKNHAPLSEFVAAALRVPLAFQPGTKYSYSSMAILLAIEIARRLSGKGMLDLVTDSVLRPLGMSRSAIGLGSLRPDEVIPVQIEHAAVEAGGGDPTAKDWDWNSPYWRGLGAPWGGVHASAADIMKFLNAFVSPTKSIVSPSTAKTMIGNHNPSPLVRRGIGFALGPSSICSGCSDSTYGHTGSTGTLAWLDPARDVALVVLTSLPGQATDPHPRELASDCLTKR